MTPLQRWEILTQMKTLVLQDPVAARTLLLSKPQLAYGLLELMVNTDLLDRPTAESLLEQAARPSDPRTARAAPSQPAGYPAPGALGVPGAGGRGPLSAAPPAPGPGYPASVGAPGE